MNNKELAKLLLKHPLIIKINESQLWDKSVVSRVIAEELMKEQDDVDAEIEKLEASIEKLENRIEKLQSGIGPITKPEALERIEAGIERAETAIENNRKKIKTLKQQKNAAPAQKEEPEENAASATRELSRDDLVNYINTLNKLIAAMEEDGDDPTPAKNRLEKTKAKLAALDKSSEIITKAAVESESPKAKEEVYNINKEDCSRSWKSD
jgi:septal ring factor EnvC (AmiA/AmiB activator)